MRVLTFSGVLLDTGEMQLEPGFVTEAEEPERRRRGDGRGARPRRPARWRRRRCRWCVPCGYAAANGAGHPPAVAVGLVDFPEKASGLRVTYDGRTVLEREAPRPGGEPKVEWPAAIEGPEVTVRWSARADGTTASLAYSDDGGETWTPMSLPGTEEGGSRSTRAGSRAGSAACSSSSPATASTPRARDRPSTRWSRRAGCCGSSRRRRARPSAPGSPVLLAAQAFHLEERRPADGPDRLDLVARRRPGRGRPGPGHAEPGRAHDHGGGGRRVGGGERHGRALISGGIRLIPSITWP